MESPSSGYFQPMLGEAWGRAIESNEHAKAFCFVNGVDCHPVGRQGLMEEFISTTDSSMVVQYARKRIDAQARFSKVRVSELLRGEVRDQSWIDSVNPGDRIKSTGINAYTANQMHNDRWIDHLNSEKKVGEGIVRYHIELSLIPKSSVGMIQLDDLGWGIVDWSKPSEVAFAANTFEVTKIHRGEDMVDIWLRIL